MATTFLPGNRLTLLNSGDDYFPALLAAIREAEREIFLESYIFANDSVGRMVATALGAAARRGVAVRVLVDGFGARNFAEDFVPLLRAHGVETLIYRREIAPFKLRRHRLRRLHRKLVVIDARLAFVGGINIIDDNNADPAMRPRFDYAVRVEGPVLGPIHAAVLRQWGQVAWASFKRRLRIRHCLIPESHPVGAQRAAFVTNGSWPRRNAIGQAYNAAIKEARQDILLANAYFLPGLRLRHALIAAARRGVRVTILLQGVSDHPLLRYATQALYRLLLQAGIRVYEYERSFLHAKVAIVDGRWATVGSANIDPFSLFLAKEANLLVDDPAFAAQLQDSLFSAMARGAVEIRESDLDAMPWWSRGIRWASYSLARLLIGLSGYGPRHWLANDDQPERDGPPSGV